MTSEQYYKKGNEYRHQGDFQQAMNCYMEAIAIDRESPAKEALAMLKDIMDFYHKEAYNP